MCAEDIIAEVIRDTKNQAVAVMVFESQRKGFLDETKVKKEYNDNVRRKVILLLDKLKSQDTPSLDIAEEASL